VGKAKNKREERQHHVDVAREWLTHLQLFSPPMPTHIWTVDHLGDQTHANILTSPGPTIAGIVVVL
jgi:hypothetical protein